MKQMKDDLWFMKLAFEEAENAYKLDEVPVGAVIVDQDGTILSRTYNLKEKNSNPCGHAEILAIQFACQKLNDWRLNQCTLYVTLEPCPMCLAALVQARISRVVFGAYDTKGGSLSLNYKINQDSRLNHNFPIVGGVYHFECSKMLSDYFKAKRKEYKYKT
jgi:tRNA(adenine34) deaminase